VRSLVVATAFAVLVALVAPARAEILIGEDGQEAREVVGYKNGRKLKIKVVTIGYGDMEVNTAGAFVAMREAAAADGIELHVYSAFRTQEQQEWFWKAYKEGWGNKAARPGHSNHQSGRALDLYLGQDGTYQWLEANGKRFGFKRTVPGEPWHWEYVKKPAKKKKPKKKARKKSR
jgi:LAS superfamily LD-carboxypeptidase LdcB